MPTSVPYGASIQKKIFNAALFSEAVRRNSLTNLMTGPAPDAGSNVGKQKGQTAAGAPIVRITDLEKSAGDEVTMDLFHQLRQKPVMGDAKIAGKGASLKYASFALKIDQGRTMVDSGGKMSQQRTEHQLKALAKQLLSPYYNRLEDQLCLIHLAGARGDHIDADWIVPLASDPDYASIVVNTITPPTYDRHFYGGDATTIASIDAADKFSLGSVDKLRLALDEMAFPLQPVQYPQDQQAEDNPFYVMLVTPRQWYDFWISTGGADWRTLQSNAQVRAASFDHPVFKGDCVMWNNILIKKQVRPIRFDVGTAVTVCTNTADAQTTTSVAAVRVERAMLLGAQALANAYGMAGSRSRGGYHFTMNDEETDHGNVTETSIAWMNGKAKIRFEGTDGRVNDHGVMVLDTAVS